MDMSKMRESKNVQVQSLADQTKAEMWWKHMDRLLNSLGKPQMDEYKIQKPGKDDPFLNDPKFLKEVSDATKKKAKYQKEKNVSDPKNTTTIYKTAKEE